MPGQTPTLPQLAPSTLEDTEYSTVEIRRRGTVEEPNRRSSSGGRHRGDMGCWCALPDEIAVRRNEASRWTAASFVSQIAVATCAMRGMVKPPRANLGEARMTRRAPPNGLATRKVPDLPMSLIGRGEGSPRCRPRSVGRKTAFGACRSMADVDGWAAGGRRARSHRHPHRRAEGILGLAQPPCPKRRVLAVVQVHSSSSSTTYP